MLVIVRGRPFELKDVHNGLVDGSALLPIHFGGLDLKIDGVAIGNPARFTVGSVDLEMGDNPHVLDVFARVTCAEQTAACLDDLNSVVAPAGAIPHLTHMQTAARQLNQIAQVH